MQDCLELITAPHSPITITTMSSPSQSLNVIGERIIVFSSKHQASMVDTITPDMARDQAFMQLFEKVKPYTMTSVEAIYALYTSVNYVLDRNIPGDFVECGVWRGGSSLLVALMLQSKSIHDRKVILYDTFSGMPAPTEFDVDKYGRSGFEMMDEYADEIGWCYASLEDVRKIFDQQQFGFPVEFVEGDVMTTLKTQPSSEICLLRLDTDWHESTALEYEVLYPKLSTGGVLIIDDYGVWAGSRKATDDYFSTHPKPLIVRVDKEVRIAIKL
jgi:O-methyltransferase